MQRLPPQTSLCKQGLKYIIATFTSQLTQRLRVNKALAVSAGILGLLTVSVQLAIYIYTNNKYTVYIHFVVSTKEYILQQIMVNQVIYCRKAAIDQFIDRLCSLRFFELVTNFPEAFEPLFLAERAPIPDAEDLIKMLLLSPDCRSDQDREIFTMLKDFVNP